jgi:hydrogenase nickel incorporation protein HypA/HybF
VHELSITRNIVAIAVEHARGARVLRVTLEIGQLSAVMPEAVRFCFGVVSRGTLVEGATLEIIEVPGQGRCKACAAEVVLEQPLGRCACGGILDWIAGGELRVKELEIDECVPRAAVQIATTAS